MKTEHHDVLIVGAGPAGMFAAHELMRAGARDVLMVDSGYGAMNRECPLTVACNCRPCDILEGVGGSGGVSDGKLTFALDRGTLLEQVFLPEHAELLGYIDRIMIDHEIEGVRYEPDSGVIPEGFGDRVPIVFHTYPLWHVGSDGIQKFSHGFGETLRRKGVQMSIRTRALHLVADDCGVRGVIARRQVGGTHKAPTYENVEITADSVLLGVGIHGMGWLEQELTLLGFEFAEGPAGIGLRIETPAEVMDPLFDAFYDWKAVGEFAGITMRSFCCNRNGHIMPEYHKPLEIRNVNGHSYLDPAKRSKSSNFSLQAKISLDNHPNPQEFVRAVARQINALSNGHQVRQPVRQFLRAPDSDGYDESCLTYPQARWEDLASAFPTTLYEAFKQYLIALDSLVPGIITSGWAYGPEIKYHARKLPVERSTWRLQGMEDTYIIGDSTGLTGSYVSAAMTGIIAARGIMNQGA